MNNKHFIAQITVILASLTTISVVSYLQGLHLEAQQGVLVKFDWVNNTTLGPVLIYYEVQSSFNWGHGVLEGDRGLRLYTPPLFQMGYTLMRRRDMFILALEHLGREDPSLANRLLMRFVRSALYLGRGAGPS